jgi:hypothetical protein
MTKDVIFISHVTPKNNYQAAWLEAKLSLLGYKVWVDFKDLRGGDSFWPEIQTKIQQNAAKFLPLVTKEYIERAAMPKTGIRKEVSCADSVREVDKFVIPLRFDDSEYSKFPIEFQELNGFDFSSNWADGLRKLVKDLEKSNVPKSNEGENYIKKWFSALQIRNEAVERQEDYYSNWLPVKLPGTIYIHEPEVLDTNVLDRSGYAYLSESRYVITFMDRSFISEFTAIRNSYSFPIDKFQSRDDIPISSHYIAVEPNKKLVQLMNEILKKYLKQVGLGVYNQSGDKEIFYFPKKEGEKKKISLKIYGKSNKAVNGKSGEIIWHYAIAGTAKLFPLPHFKITYHLYFEKQGKTLDKDGQQENRRSVAANWYNKDWLDMLLAFFQLLKNDEEGNNLILPVSNLSTMIIACEPVKFNSRIGYVEPNSVEKDDDGSIEESIVSEPMVTK